MSGFSGWMDLQRNLSAQGGVIRSMTRCLRHRGPDVEACGLFGNVALGERRFFDAGTSGAGKFVSTASIATSRDLAVVFDGTIYNLVELSQKLPETRDREMPPSEHNILAAAYRRWGPSAAEHLDGIFAFAIWDGTKRRMVLGRDRIGLKSLYYYETPSGLLFSSEPKGIFAHPAFEAAMAVSKLPIVLQPRLARPGETPLQGLRELPPAHVMVCDSSGLRPLQYWRLECAEHTHSYSQTVVRVRELLEESVTRQCPDGRCAAMLSGGLDSTSVVALASRTRGSDEPIETFCLELESSAKDFVSTELRPEIDSPYAAAAATAIGTSHRVVHLTAEALHAAIPRTRDVRGLPGWGQFDASMYLLFGEVRRTCRTVLTGEAADELFAGYPYLFKPETRIATTFPWMGNAPRLSDYLARHVVANFDPRNDEQQRYREAVAAVPKLKGEDAEQARMREVLYLGMGGPLSVVLDRKERMSMAHGLQVRVPFCDHRLIEYAWNIPWSMKSRSHPKGLLKDAVQDVVPESTLRRKKSAYPHIQHSDYDRALVAQTREILADRSYTFSSLFDRVRLGALVDKLAATGTGETGGRSFPGGASAVYLLANFVEGARWFELQRVRLTQ